MSEAEEVLSHTSNEALLRTFAALTHRLHGVEGLMMERDLRAQRDMVQAEILRRME
jgi:S-adenosylmethionine:diacylglycerol 3-amino-3-carboxypropyl transferase